LITASFRHLSGIGPLRERQLWRRGVRTWADLPEGPIDSPRLDQRLRDGVAESVAHYLKGELDWFAGKLPPNEQWRLLPHLLEGAAFLDIETAGTTRAPGEPDQVTVIGVLDARGAHAFVAGRDLAAFPARTADWRALITFNGASFDVPTLKKAFPLWSPPACHIDLCPLWRRLGEKGGLKRIEPRLGLIRPPHLARLTGEDAIWLWHAQRRGDRTALKRLIEYCLTDTAHLKTLAELGYNRMLQRTGMAGSPLPVTERGELLYDVTRAAERAALGQAGVAEAKAGE
jgi:uncharacterized protein